MVLLPHCGAVYTLDVLHRQGVVPIVLAFHLLRRLPATAEVRKAGGGSRLKLLRRRSLSLCVLDTCISRVAEEPSEQRPERVKRGMYAKQPKELRVLW